MILSHTVLLGGGVTFKSIPFALLTRFSERTAGAECVLAVVWAGEGVEEEFEDEEGDCNCCSQEERGTR